MDKLNDLIRQEKHTWIQKLVSSKSFIDVGGLWGTVNETVTLAALAGATRYAMADIQPQSTKWWLAFEERCSQYSVSNYERYTINICNNNVYKVLGKWDIVHCSGIIYHVSDPIQLLSNLFSITNEYLIITSMVIPEVINNELGMLLTPEGTAHLIPAMSLKQKQIILEHYKSLNLDSFKPEYKFSELFLNDGRVNSGPWWWIFSAATLKAMCSLFNVEIIDASSTAWGSYSILCKK